eukprot:1045047-Pyramimonas_sp.AAC.1
MQREGLAVLQLRGGRQLRDEEALSWVRVTSTTAANRLQGSFAGPDQAGGGNAGEAGLAHARAHGAQGRRQGRQAREGGRREGRTAGRPCEAAQ